MLVSTIFCISCRSVPGTPSTYFWVPFLIINGAPIATGTVFVSTFLSFLFQGLYIWEAYWILSLKYFYQQLQWHPTWCMFVPGAFDYYVWSICIEQQSFIKPIHFSFYYWLWCVFVQFFWGRYLVMLAYYRSYYYNKKNCFDLGFLQSCHWVSTSHLEQQEGTLTLILLLFIQLNLVKLLVRFVRPL